MALNRWQQLRALSMLTLRIESGNIERFISPVLFAASTLLIFSFSLSGFEPRTQTAIFIAQLFLAIFLALQLSLTRVFTAEEEDQAFTILRTYPISPELWFVSKYVVVVLFSMGIGLACMGLSVFLNQDIQIAIPFAPLVLVLLLSVIGLAAVGVLLAGIVLRADTRDVLFPVIYFPLTAPVLLAATQSASIIIMEGKPAVELLQSWLGLLIIFDIVYVTLSVMLFGELLKSD